MQNKLLISNKKLNTKIIIKKNYISKFIKNIIKNSEKVFCIVDSKVNIDLNLPKQKNIKTLSIQCGEKIKTIKGYNDLVEKLIKHNVNRRSVIIAIGGGTLGDLAGFVASTLLRGLDFYLIPTTLLSQVDSSIGGKNGINFLGFKNQIGTFKNPISVYIDTNFLNTLETNQWLSGYVEIVKSALIYDSDFWTLLSSKFYKDHNINELIFKSLKIKKEIVEKDPFDKGQRKILNFGHTIGHAIESFYLNKKKKITHGKAIAMGIIMELKYSRTRKKNEIIKYIKSIYNEIEEVDINYLIKYLKHDKKNEDNLINFSILKEIGKCDFNNHINIDDL